MQTKFSLQESVTLRRLPVITICVYTIALLAWVAIIGRWLPMPGSGSQMVMSMTDPGAPEMMALSNGFVGVFLYLLMWGVMMIAMMYPSSVPLLRMYDKTIQGKSKTARMAHLSVFLGTYTLIWTVIGLVPLAVNSVFPIASIATGSGTYLLAGTLLGLSVYQLSPYKNHCLTHCRSPLGFLMQYHRSTIRGAAGLSIRFSVFCVGCCSALFAFMVVVGSMNVLWMALITVVLSVERMGKWGDKLSTAVGMVSGIGGVGILLLNLPL